MKKEEIVTMSLPYPIGGSKKVRVYIPEHEEGEKFPVIYMTDGQNLFEDDTVQFGCWYTREAVRSERQKSGRAAVIVGIHNDESDLQRTCELTPASIGEIPVPDDAPEEVKKMLRPTGEIFDDFVVNTLKPVIEERFPIKTGRNNTAFCGSSCGGLAAFFIAVSNPEIFCASGVFSPVFFIYSKEDMKNWIVSKVSKNMPCLYIYTGAADELEKQICESVEQTYGILEENYPSDMLKKVVIPEYKHHETAWMPVFRDFLEMFLSLGEGK